VVGEIRSHGERMHMLADDTLQRIGQG